MKRPSSAPENTPPAGRLKRFGVFLHVEPSINPVYFYGRALTFVGVVLWGVSLVVTPLAKFYEGGQFIHNVNLVFHEAGHTIFRVFGHFIYVLGGSLGQILIPVICLFALLIKTKDPFGAAICLCWTAENLMDVAVYVNDARALRLPLLGGIFGYEDPDFHDWHVILNELDMLHYDHVMAMMLYGSGIFFMLVAFAWAGVMLYLQFGRMKGGWDGF